MKLLHIDSSALGAQSVTRELTAAVVAQWRRGVPGLAVDYRDLAFDPVPHLSSASLAGSDPLEAAESERVLRQFLAADVVVIGAPMYNFAIPSTLKAWLDRVTVAGKTFRYTDAGPVGLVAGKRVIVASARGGLHAGAPSDFVEPYLSFVLGFMGIKDVTFVRAEGMAISPQHRSEAIAATLAALPGPLREAA